MTLPLFSSSPLTDDKPKKTARKYQERGIIALRAHVLMEKTRILGVLPTGGGKMFLTAAMTRSATIPMLFVAHRQELIDQCARELADFGLTNIGVIRGNDERYNPAASIQIASIQTLARRDKPFLGEKRVLIFIDECHRSASESYQTHVFGAYDKNGIIIGWTATPWRLDHRPLGGDSGFEVIEVLATYDELLKHPDWLARPDIFGAPPLDLSQVRTSGSDFDEEQLAEVMHTGVLEGQLVEHWVKWADKHPVLTPQGLRIPGKFTTGEPRRTIGFAVNIAHSMACAERFEKLLGLGKVAHLDAKTPDATRKAAWVDSASGKLQMVWNCNIGVEGIDVPPIKCVIDAAPTQSLTRHRQRVGRGMRPWQGVVPFVLDHAGNMDRLGCPFEDLHWSLTAKPVRGSGRLPMKMCRTCFAYCEPSKYVCPFCGAEFPKAEDRPVPAETNAELVMRQTEPEALKVAFYSRQVTMAKSRGFKPGYASAMYKEHYGCWPPREWSDRTKAEFAQDGAWQMSLQRRLEKKAVREAQDKREEEELAKSKIEERVEDDAGWIAKGSARWSAKGKDWTAEATYADGRWSWSVWDDVRKVADVGEALRAEDAKVAAEVALTHLFAGRPKTVEEAAMEKTLDAMDEADPEPEVRGESEFGDWLESEGIGQ